MSSKGFKPQIWEMIEKLQVRFPAAFPKPPAPKVPLALGTVIALYKYKKELGPKWLIKAAVGMWINSADYHAVCLQPGTPRFALDGNPMGQVNEEYAARSAVELKNALEKHARRRTERTRRCSEKDILELDVQGQSAVI